MGKKFCVVLLLAVTLGFMWFSEFEQLLLLGEREVHSMNKDSIHTEILDNATDANDDNDGNDDLCTVVPYYKNNGKKKKKKHRIALYAFWKSASNEPDELQKFHPSFIASICQNSDLVDVYWIKIGPGPSLGKFKPFICPNLFVTRFNRSFFFEQVNRAWEPHTTLVFRQMLKSSQQADHAWMMMPIRASVPSVFEAFWPGLLSRYSHWGWVETDMILGKFSDFLTDAHLENYDVLSSREWTTMSWGMLWLSGQVAIFRNTPFLNKLWQPCFRTIPPGNAFAVDEGLWSDCVLSQSFRYNGNQTLSLIFSSPWVAAFRKECGLSYHGVTPALVPEYLDPKEAEECKKNAQPYLRMRFLRNGANVAYSSVLSYKGKLLAQNHKCTSHLASRARVWKQSCKTPDQLQCRMNFTRHLSGYKHGANWVHEKFRHFVADVPGSMRDYLDMLHSDCDWSIERGVISSVVPGTLPTLVYEFVSNKTYKSPVLGTLDFDLEFDQDLDGMGVLPGWWDEPECLTPVMWLHLKYIKKMPLMNPSKDNSLELHPPLHTPLRPSDLVIAANFSFAMGFRSFDVNSSPNLFKNSSYCGPFCVDFGGPLDL